MLKALPERHLIRVVAVDMWAPYRDAVRALIPRAILIVDPCEIDRLVKRTLVVVRKRAVDDPSARKRDRLLRSGHLLAERRSRLLPPLLTELDEWLNFVPALHAVGEGTACRHLG
ncbi:transposase [Bradyrhizobium sp. CCBAU 53380]|uniref:transposase n=1 Tax=Bradyrhizobium sp. CCBAU 53380 TaxID=1325117 RepID=UPI003FA447DA